MLRVATKKSVEKGLKHVRKQTTQAAPPPPKGPASAPKKSGGSGLALTLGALTAGGAGVVGYSYVDPEFRAKVESTIPQTKPVFDKILGESNLSKTKQQITDLKESVVSALPKKKEVLPPLPVKELPPIEKKTVINVEPVDLKKETVLLPVKPSPELAASQNKSLEKALLSAIQAAESRVHSATEAKVQTINAINNHAALLKKTVDDGQNADWEKVTSALQQAESQARKDSSVEADGRNFIDALRKIIADGKANQLTSSNPLLINATETANKLGYQLDELNGLVTKARAESQILNQYKDLIERSRQQFALEMKSILPNVDLNAKDKKLSEDELNALIAHAHLKVDQLRKQLSDQQVREEQHIMKAIEDQRRTDERIANDHLQLELVRVSQQKEQDVERVLLTKRASWEAELEDHLKRAAAAHSEHLEQVIRTQRQLFDIEHNQKLEEAVTIEREHHSRAVGAAISRLEGIEHALNSRVALDAENRKSKQVWIACHNLIDYIKHGNKAGNTVDERRLPLSGPLNILKEINPDDEFSNILIGTISDETKKTGVFTEQDLKNRFDALYKVGRRTASIGVNGGSLMQYIWSYTRSLFLLELPRKYSVADKLDPASLDNIEVLARAKWHIERGDFEGAVRVVQLLQGQPAELARDWIQDTRAHLETRLLAELLVAHAAVTSIRSTY